MGLINYNKNSHMCGMWVKKSYVDIYIYMYMCIDVGICIGIRASSYLADSLGAAWVLCGAVYQPKRPENSCRHVGPDCHNVDET